MENEKQEKDPVAQLEEALTRCLGLLNSMGGSAGLASAHADALDTVLSLSCLVMRNARVVGNARSLLAEKYKGDLGAGGLASGETVWRRLRQPGAIGALGWFEDFSLDVVNRRALALDEGDAEVILTWLDVVDRVQSLTNENLNLRQLAGLMPSELTKLLTDCW